MVHTSGCAVRVRGQERSFVYVDRISGSVNMSVRQQTEKLSSRTITRESKSSVMEEELYLSTRGYVFDPMLMSYLVGAGFGLSQQDFEMGDESGSSSGTMSRYDLSASLLPGKPYPFSVSSRKGESIATRRFLSPLHVEESADSVSAKLLVPNWPMAFSWSNSELKRSSDTGSSRDLYNRSQERFSYLLSHDFSDRSRIDYQFNMSDITQGGEGYVRQMDSTSHRLLHNYDFGSRGQYTLGSNISLSERSGDFENEVFTWSEDLSAIHSEKLSSYYNGYFTRNEYAGNETDTIGGMAGIRHKLYDNLKTDLSSFIGRSDFSSGSESNWHGGKLKVDYFRNNPWGLLTARYMAQLTNRESSGLAGTDIVVGELHRFTDPDAVMLNERNVSIDTIVVTSADGDEVYEEGIDGDYTVRQVGDRFELVIDTNDDDLPNISDGDDILVDYLYIVEGSQEIESFLQNFRIEQEFNNGISVYYSYISHQNEYESSLGFRGFGSVDESETNIFGTSYRNDRLRLTAEHSETDSSLNSLVRDRLSATANWPLTPRTSLRGRVSQTWMEADGNRDLDMSLFKAAAGIKTRINRYLKLSGEAELRKEDSSDIGVTDGWKIGTALEYNRRALSVRVGLDFYFLDRAGRERESTMFYLRLTRRF